MKKTSNKTKNIAVCGVFAALATVFLYIGSFTVFDLSILMVCALVTMLIVIECGVKYAWIYSAAVTVIAAVLIPQKIYVIEYALFGAVYPILKLYFEKLRQIFAVPLKISLLDCMLLVCLILGQKVFLLGDDYFSLNLITMCVGTAFFLLFDFALTMCVSFYLVKLHKKIRNKFFS